MTIYYTRRHTQTESINKKENTKKQSTLNNINIHLCFSLIKAVNSEL